MTTLKIGDKVIRRHNAPNDKLTKGACYIVTQVRKCGSLLKVEGSEYWFDPSFFDSEVDTKVMDIWNWNQKNI